MGCNLHSTDDNGDTALHYASYLENKEIMNWLIKKGIDKDAKNNDGDTPYD